MGHKLIYMTASSHEEAQTIARDLLEKRLVACVNIFPGIQSMYWWNGKIHNDSEVAMTAKTTQVLVPGVIEAVKAKHGYDCPCVVTLPIEDGNPEFLKWIGEETVTA